LGAFLTNYHVRSTSKAACAKALVSLIRSRAMVTDPKNGWITIYDETSESQDLAELRRLAKNLSSKLKTSVFSFMVHDSDIFVYLLYDKGTFVDQYDSRPDYFGPVTDQHRKAWVGHFNKLVKFATSKTTPERISKVMGEPQIVEEERAARLADLLGIDPVRAREGFKYARKANHNYELVCGRKHSARDAELIEAVSNRDASAVRTLLENGASPNQFDPLGYTLLVGAISRGATEIAESLIVAGADVLAQGKLQGDALWIASADGHLKILEALLSKARGDARLPKSLEAALRAAVLNGQIDAVPLLLHAGADLDRLDEGGQSLLILASLRGLEGFWEIQTKKAFPKRPGTPGKDWPKLVELLLKSGANPDFQTGDGTSALMVAAARGNLEICSVLVRAGADVNLKHQKGSTALALARAGGHRAIAELLEAASDQGKK
jgi:ankyrin repeat protein